MILHQKSGHTRQNRIRNECIKKKVGRALIVKNIVESHLKWFRLVWRRSIEATIESRF